MSNLKIVYTDFNRHINENSEFYDIKTSIMWKKHRGKLLDFLDSDMTAEYLRSLNPSMQFLTNSYLYNLFFTYEKKLTGLIEVAQVPYYSLEVRTFSNLKLCEFMLFSHLFLNGINFIDNNDQQQVRKFFSYEFTYELDLWYKNFDQRLFNHSYMMLRNLMVNFNP